MSVGYIIFFFVMGLILGSFYNVVGLRLPLNKSFIDGRSICQKCGQTLKWYELVPVLSYLIQSGRCNYCFAPIPIFYPTIEFSTGFFFLYSYIEFGLSIDLWVSVSLISLLMIIFVSDVYYMIIPNKVLLFFLPIFIILRILEPLQPWWSSILGGVAGVSLIAFIIIVSRGGMGAGDMKLFGLLGIVLGFQKVLLTFFLACLIGSIVGGLQLLLNKIKRKQYIPFGPHIVMATFMTYYFGDPLLTLYKSFF